MYIDTGNSFRPERLRSIADRFNLSKKAVLENIEFIRVRSTAQHERLIETVRRQMKVKSFTLLIVDSATSYYRTDYVGRGDLAGRQQHLGQFLRQLQKLADDFELVVVITNFVVAQVGGKRSSSGATRPTPRGIRSKPGGGSVVGAATQTRLSLRMADFERRICKVYKSASLPEAESIFDIGEGGIKDEQTYD